MLVLSWVFLCAHSSCNIDPTANVASSTSEPSPLPERWKGCTLPRVDPETVSSLSDFSTPVLLANSTLTAWWHLFQAPLNVTELLHPVNQAEVEVRLPIGVNQVRASVQFRPSDCLLTIG